MTTKQHNGERSLPKRIILVRHGESQGNLDMAAYTTTPDYRIPLTRLGVEQARAAGRRIRHVVSDGGQAANWKVYFYVSPYERTRLTLREIGRAFSKKRIIGVREECRVREQDFGNFQVEDRMKVIKETRDRFGRFFFRFPEGESAADVYDRVARMENDILLMRTKRTASVILQLKAVEGGGGWVGEREVGIHGLQGVAGFDEAVSEDSGGGEGGAAVGEGWSAAAEVGIGVLATAEGRPLGEVGAGGLG
uniref:Phosphoglycerate mutase-like protein AT74H isoform X3 n=1 Tax=Elaeis guineensis var. tenera TaxID=51953 RepID=A0A8N4I533_ELAGV|nr:phosphoglycerate mutase-like protein AT74H isoform X3 [Elaeis guineensis]